MGFCSNQGGWGKPLGQQGFVQLCLAPTTFLNLLKTRWGGVEEHEPRESGELWKEASSIAIIEQQVPGH